MSGPTPTLHPAQNRGLRELYATARHLAGHWEALGSRFGDGDARQVLIDGAGRARALTGELASVRRCGWPCSTCSTS